MSTRWSDEMPDDQPQNEPGAEQTGDLDALLDSADSSGADAAPAGEGHAARGRGGAGAGLLDLLARPLVLAVIGVLVIALAAWGAVAVTSRTDTYRVSAMFSNAPGIYPGNAVTVLGVRVGRVESITPDPTGVKVVMRIESETKIPDDVKAYLMAPNVVNDRFIELDPGYTGGSTLPPGTTLPMDRTVIPQSVDQIVASIDRLATDLGPSGANEDGSLSRLLHSIAATLGGSGGSLNSSIRNLGEVFAAVSEDTDSLTGMLNDLGGLTHAAAGVSEQYQALAGDLAKVSTTLAGDDEAIAASIENLARVLGELNTFVKKNKTQLKGTLTSMSKVAATVGEQQKALAQSMRLLPLAVDNTGRSVADGGVKTRFNQVNNSKLHTQICGDGLLRLLLLSLSPQNDDNKVMSLACGTNELLQTLRPGAGAPDASALTRKALQGMGGN